MTRSQEIYITPRNLGALRLLAREGESVEAVLEKIIETTIDREHPGLFAVIDECNAAYEKVRAENKQRYEAWKEKQAG